MRHHHMNSNRPLTNAESAIGKCGTRAVLAAAFGPDTAGELACASTLLNALDATMLLLAEAGHRQGAAPPGPSSEAHKASNSGRPVWAGYQVDGVPRR